MKRFVLMVWALLVVCGIYSQTPDNYTLTVCGDGTTLQEATDNALRSAVGQAYGVYVSSNTAILNDEIVRDEIGTLASGNILDYKVLAHTTAPDGTNMVTLQTTVSVTNLTSFAKAKGSKIEFAGALFGANLRLIESAKKNERIVINHFIKQVEIFLDNCGPLVTPKLLESKPRKGGESYYVELKYRSVQTKAPGELFTMVYDFLRSIALTEAEVKMYREMDEKTYGVACYIGQSYSANQNYGHYQRFLYLRTDQYKKLAGILDYVDNLTTITAKDVDGNVVAVDKEKYRRAYTGGNIDYTGGTIDGELHFCYFWRQNEDGTIATDRLYNDTGHVYTSFSPSRGNGYSGLTAEQMGRIASIEMENQLVYSKGDKVIYTKGTK